MWEVMTAYAITHNMIIEDECDDNMYDQGWKFEGKLITPRSSPSVDFADFLQVHHKMRDRATHNRLQQDLFVHTWNHAGRQ
jgi:hypothetical protein